MMALKKLLVGALFLEICTHVSGLVLDGKRYTVTSPVETDGLQDLVTWDEHSLFVRGERLMLFSAEFHPWRLPVPGLWLDIFQKIKALGYTGVSFYVDWALLEGNPGHFSAEGVFAYEPFFQAAKEAGIYLIARPGPYINAEVSGGGFPAWQSRNPAVLRTNETGYLASTQVYVSNMGKIIADAQITNGGPVVLLQPENEYTYGEPWILFPDVKYIEAVKQQYRDAGIVVPLINNEASIIGLFTPDKPGGPNIYGHDGYPIGFNCAEPNDWIAGNLPTDWRELHLEMSPSTPYTIPEFQGGAIDSWGGTGLELCADLTNAEFERVFYKNDFSFGLTILSFYMTYGGTNWGNLGESGGYTSYDYGAAIKEDRTITREKYAEAKLIGQFITSSPAYLSATPGNLTNTSYVSTPELTTTPIFGNPTTFYVTRHSAYESLDSTSYTFTVPTSAGNVTIPQLGGTLTLNGRDSKIHVTDYDVGGLNLVYSSADIYTYSSNKGGKRVLLLYGLEGETHELAFSSKLGKPTVEGGTAKIATKGSTVVVQWEVTTARKVLHYGSELDVYLLWRNDAFNYWKLELESPAPIGNFTSQSKDSIIAKAGYLLRTAAISGTSLHLTGDLNATADLEIIAGLPGSNEVYFNGKQVAGVEAVNGRLQATLTYEAPELHLPDLASLEWKAIDSLPEIKNSYDDSAWTDADHTTTNNTSYNDDTIPLKFRLQTPTSLIASDYGFNTGSLLYRGYFISHGNESSIYLATQGGVGYGHSVWLNETFIGSFVGTPSNRSYNETLPLPSSSLVCGKTYVLTVLIDHMGQETNWTPGLDMMKQPRGINNYALSGHPQSDVTWKLTGNLGGEQYRDIVRGPLNEGGMWAERHGYHLPSAPTAGWSTASPIADGVSTVGVSMFAAKFDLNIPAGYDVPLSFVFTNTTNVENFRVQLYVNGWQFGEYINNLGPQTNFPVPEGVLNHGGTNYLAITLWAQDAAGAKLGGLSLVPNAVIQSGMQKPALTWTDVWTEREGAY